MDQDEGRTQDKKGSEVYTGGLRGSAPAPPLDYENPRFLGGFQVPMGTDPHLER